MFLRRTLLTITFNQALIFFLILAKKIIFSSDAFLMIRGGFRWGRAGRAPPPPKIGKAYVIQR
jgi:hypothetical protein